MAQVGGQALVEQRRIVHRAQGEEARHAVGGLQFAADVQLGLAHHQQQADQQHGDEQAADQQAGAAQGGNRRGHYRTL
ncbi:hypothetical protein D3C86_2141910 [compost metagenome]